ncbi:PTS sugar transporter subunit IIC [Listeria monocytogenes]|uniref:PTS mannose/fructose/sorbose/N-acetylgalactosamine transporter subunit IIC n=1 Tax=Listeria monocytogenes TaxID=1639 RepID=UPI0010F21F40|nr:PTS sugar transporter subunit IIC [Listeria monocytogenes]EAF4531651.1 PTS sugar transporter subunit IIC [Listeria monocytogenes serotype 1/2a]EAD7632611.1 PTS sugar transporter subunit IIC [Listeria monocytogenes]EAG4504448.1 PTS sugar transporter subunit IIC [Listeria monocytogenes]EDH3594596.1 PTS sorbose transporter subunit IIC [Listeria monocytogenes]EHT9627395.1 PTS sugar transporter subunit IIC [Listeria monocytogenes]
MELQIWQIIILSLLGFYAIVENLGINIFANQALIIGTITGLVMGDLETGLAVGATLQLMGLGIQAYGGASVPDYMTASIVGTAFAVISGKGVEFGIGLAVPVALLMIQLDILARFCNVFFQKRIDHAIIEMKPSKIRMFHLMGTLSWGLSRGLPIFLVFSFGESIVEFVSNVIPEWLTGGLSVAGGMLPAVGIAILLRYLPVKNFITYLILGFIAVSYVSMPMFGVALLGLALAILQFKKLIEEKQTEVKSVTIANVEGGLSADEYED